MNDFLLFSIFNFSCFKQEDISGKDMSVPHEEALDQDPEGGGVVIAGPGHCEGLTAQQAVGL